MYYKIYMAYQDLSSQGTPIEHLKSNPVQQIPQQMQQGQEPEPEPDPTPMPRFPKRYAQKTISPEMLADNLNMSQENVREYTNKNEEKDNTNKKKIIDKVPEILREPLIILILYIVLSQDIVRRIIGEYIPQIRPGENGVVSFTGMVIYGLILVLLFVIFKKLLIK